MQYRIIGVSDLSLSAVAFGCGGNAGLMIRGTPQEQTRIVARALELGINYFDNAPDYGNGIAESNLGRALKELGAKPLLNSKVEIRAENLADIADHVVASTEASLKRLGVDHLDMLQIHNGPVAKPPLMEGKYYTQLSMEHYTGPGGAIEGVERLRRAGKIRYAGFICRGNDGAEVRQILDTKLFHLINVPFTLFNPTAGYAAPGLKVGKDYGGVIDYAHSVGAGAAIYSPLASGFLTDDALRGDNRHPLARAYDMNAESSVRLRKQAAAVSFLARDNGITLAQAAFRFILTHPGVTAGLGGFSTIEQLEEIAAVPDMGPFSADAMTRLNHVWAENFGV
jgi:aryl-alcohol dehydrogenase-like predicted oxidoreductase